MLLVKHLLPAWKLLSKAGVTEGEGRSPTLQEQPVTLYQGQGHHESGHRGSCPLQCCAGEGEMGPGAEACRSAGWPALGWPGFRPGWKMEGWWESVSGRGHEAHGGLLSVEESQPRWSQKPPRAPEARREPSTGTWKRGQPSPTPPPRPMSLAGPFAFLHLKIPPAAVNGKMERGSSPVYLGISREPWEASGPQVSSRKQPWV